MISINKIKKILAVFRAEGSFREERERRSGQRSSFVLASGGGEGKEDLSFRKKSLSKIFGVCGWSVFGRDSFGGGYVGGGLPI